MKRISCGYYHIDVAGDEQIACVDIAKLADLLPHGSGIDSDYLIGIHDDGNVTITTDYHAIDENGVYDGWRHITLRIFRHTTRETRNLIGPCAGMTQILHDIGDVDFEVNVQILDDDCEDSYFDDLFYDSLSPFLTPLRPAITPVTQSGASL